MINLTKKKKILQFPLEASAVPLAGRCLAGVSCAPPAARTASATPQQAGLRSAEGLYASPYSSRGGGGGVVSP